MSAHIADRQFSFQLPSLSYIDAKWEEPALREPARKALPPRTTGIADWLAMRFAAVVAWRRNRIAMAELNQMSDRELLDVGLSRADVSRVFDARLSEDLRQRGAGL